MWVIFENSLNHFSALYSDLLDEWFYAVMNGHRNGWGSTAFIQILKILLGYRYIECIQPHSLDSLFLFSTCLAKSQQALSLTLCLFSYSSWTSLEKKKHTTIMIHASVKLWPQIPSGQSYISLGSSLSVPLQLFSLFFSLIFYTPCPFTLLANDLLYYFL